MFLKEGPMAAAVEKLHFERWIACGIYIIESEWL